MFISSLDQTKGQRRFRNLLRFLIIFSLAFIFSQSLLTPEKASDEREIVSDIVNEVLPEITPEDSGITEKVDSNLDVIAHFAEFFVFGFFLSLYIVLYAKRPAITAVLSLPIGFVVGAFDEFLQKFSGRFSQPEDVIVDSIGYLCASLCVYIFCLCIALIGKKRRSNG